MLRVGVGGCPELLGGGGELLVWGGGGFPGVGPPGAGLFLAYNL